VLFPNPKAPGVGVDVLPNTDCAPVFDPAVADACVPKGEGALDLLVDEVLPNPKENVEVVELAGGSPGVANVDGVVELELPPNTDDDFGASASLLAVDEVVLPPLPNENVDLGA
jgi:hypothetical protein